MHKFRYSWTSVAKGDGLDSSHKIPSGPDLYCSTLKSWPFLNRSRDGQLHKQHGGVIWCNDNLCCSGDKLWPIRLKISSASWNGKIRFRNLSQKSLLLSVVAQKNSSWVVVLSLSRSSAWIFAWGIWVKGLYTFILYIIYTSSSKWEALAVGGWKIH